jgi:hypothetical protein
LFASGFNVKPNDMEPPRISSSIASRRDLDAFDGQVLKIGNGPRLGKGLLEGFKIDNIVMERYNLS